MKKQLDAYRRTHNELIGAMEKQPSGDHKAWLDRVVQYVRKELILVENMIDEDKPAHEINKVFDRIDTAFSRIK